MRDRYERQDRKPCRNADSHAGPHDGFTIYWAPISRHWAVGWMVDFPDARIKPVGPFATSQEAFCAVKAVIDELCHS